MYDKHALATEIRLCEQQSETLWAQAQNLRTQADAARKHHALMQNVERILVALSTGSKAQQDDAITELRRMVEYKNAPAPKEKVFPARRGSWLYSVCEYPTLYVLDWPMRESGSFWSDRGYEINEAGLALLAYIDRQSTLSEDSNDNPANYPVQVRH